MRLLLILFSLLLTGCASSNVSRYAASEVDKSYSRVKGMGQGSVSLADTYQNTNQATKGAIIGGVTGTMAGALSSSIGIVPGAIGGALIGAVYGSYIDANTTLQDRLINRGVTVVIIGDQVLIMLPSYRLFYPWSAQLKPQAYSTLQLVSLFIQSMTNMSVMVQAYMGESSLCRSNLIVTKKQADNVARFLWKSGINTRLLYAEGRGSTHLVEEDTGGWDGTDNNRIEITLEKLPF